MVFDNSLEAIVDLPLSSIIQSGECCREDPEEDK